MQLLFTRRHVLDDVDPMERTLGIEAGLLWCAFAARSVSYANLGIPDGMRHGPENAREAACPTVDRTLDGLRGALVETPGEILLCLGL